MQHVAGEVAKKALENVGQNMGDGVAGRKGGFDVPGEQPGFGAKDMGKGETGKLGSSFDGPWDNPDTGKGEGERLGSSFDGHWAKPENEQTTISCKETSQGISEHSGENARSRIPSINDRLAGATHPDTGVPYDVKQSERPDGKKVELVMPEFESAYETNLDKNEKGNYTGTRADHEKQCNEKLTEGVKNDSKVADTFSKEQLEQIKNGDTPDGYTWHHDAKPGNMKLVDSKVHAETRHTGGYSVWGKDI
ncbi:HNH endonuclease [Desulfonatronum lacustre]|uniref:HNH endonuclease n=1 Tax=Desulfonatronum lacustre TaxID=66849 RepID=UPI000A04E3D4|nr:HNH endonuclease [Desulfonatronum lacustre]